MNISKTNSVNFTGKQEIIYGLKKAAKEAKNIELNRSYAFGPRPIRREAEIYEAKGALNAYADMVTKDKEFGNVIKELAEDKEFTQELGNTLQEKDMQFGKINPLAEFVKTFTTAIKDNSTNSLTEDVKAFFKNIKM